MLRKFYVSALVAGLFVVLSVSGSTALNAAEKRKFIAIGTGGPTGVYFVAGNAICRMVHRIAKGREGSRNHGIRCSAPSTGGSTYNIDKIEAGELHFGVAQSDAQFSAIKGLAHWRDRKANKLRAVFSIHPEPFHIVVSGNSDIRAWNDLKGKRVNIGNPGSGQRSSVELMMRVAGWTLKDFALAAELSSTQQSRALCSGKIDAYIYSVGVPNAGVSIAADGCGARIIDFNRALARRFVTSSNPHFSWTTIEKGTYKTVVNDVETWGVKATLVTSTDVDEAIVYEVARSVFENLKEFKTLHPAFKHLKPKEMVSTGLSAPLHPGAAKYFREKGLLK